MTVFLVGQSPVISPATPTTAGVLIPHPPVAGILPGDVLFAAEFLGGYSTTHTGWHQYDNPPGPDPYPGNADNKWTYPPPPTLGGFDPASWMNGLGAFWHPFKVWKGTETAHSLPCEREAQRGWAGINSSDPRYGYEGLFVCGALRGVDPIHPVACGLTIGSGHSLQVDVSPTYLGPTGVYGSRYRYLGETLPVEVIGKRALWIFACEWNGAQEILNNLRPLTWGAFDGQVTYQTLYFGSAGPDAFQDAVAEEGGRTFGYASGVAVLTSPLPSNVIPNCDWLLRCRTSAGLLTNQAGPFGSMIVLNELPEVPLSATASPVVGASSTFSMTKALGAAVTVEIAP